MKWHCQKPHAMCKLPCYVQNAKQLLWTRHSNKMQYPLSIHGLFGGTTQSGRKLQKLKLEQEIIKHAKKASKAVCTILSMSHDWCSLLHCPSKQSMHALQSRFVFIFWRIIWSFIYRVYKVDPFKFKLATTYCVNLTNLKTRSFTHGTT
jgi:hypothetical protein